MAVLTELEKHWRKRDAQDRRDQEAFEQVDEEVCMLCEAKGEDKRTLRIDCFYDIKEAIPEALSLIYVKGEKGYYLNICKDCRGELLLLLSEWRERMLLKRPLQKDSDGHPYETDHERNIPVRQYGAIKMMSYEEYMQYENAKSTNT